MNHLLQVEPREKAVNAERLEEQRRTRKAQQAPHPFGRELRLRQPQYFIAPAAQMLTVFFIKPPRIFAVLQVAFEMAHSVLPPFGVARGQFRDAQPFAYAAKHVEKLMPLRPVEWAMQKRVRALGIIDQHVEHVAEGPIWHQRAALLFDGFVDRMDLIERPPGRRIVNEDDLLRVAHRREEPPDRVSRDLPCEEQPIHRAIERELGRRSGEDQQNKIGTSPDRADNRTSGNKVRHFRYDEFARALPRRRPDYFLRVDDGQTFSRPHFSHIGLRAWQTLRPCQINRWEKSIQSFFGRSSIRSASIFSGCLFTVNPSRCDRRDTCVSTTTPVGIPKAAPRTTLAVLRPTPGSSTNSSSVCGTWPLCFSISNRLAS